MTRELPSIEFNGRLGYSNPPLWKLVRQGQSLRLVPRRSILVGAAIIWSTMITLMILVGLYFDERFIALGGGVLFTAVICVYVLWVLHEHAKGTYLELSPERVSVPRRDLKVLRSSVVGFELISGRARPASPKFVELNLLYTNTDDKVVRVPIAGDLSGGPLARTAEELCRFADIELHDRRLD